VSQEGVATPLGHGVWSIPLPLPFPALRWTNAYVIEGGGGLTLVDCGVATRDGKAALERGVAAVGHDLGDVVTLVGTHMHPDHIGLAAELVDEIGCRLVMHESAADALPFYNDWSLYRAELHDFAGEHGVPDDVREMIGADEPRPDWAGTMVEPDAMVAGGDEIPVADGRRLDVIHTPGHERTHICLVDSLTGALFSGDHVLSRITPVIQYHRDEDPLGDYLSSLALIERMEIGLTYPAHVAVLDRGSLRARQIALHHERRLGGILQFLRAGPATAWEILEAIFRPNLNPLETRLAFSETLAHVAYLRRRDELARFSDEGTWYYRLPERKRT
jgi:glyoxylase-like metal-dependent hydrolase (beta-lactamase superfamily II)